MLELRRSSTLEEKNLTTPSLAVGTRRIAVSFSIERRRPRPSPTTGKPSDPLASPQLGLLLAGPLSRMATNLIRPIPL